MSVMNAIETRFAVEDLLHAYVDCLDHNRLEEWPDFFVEDCLYQIIPHENESQDLPISLIYCDSRGMLQDRVTAHRTANYYAPHLYRHIVSGVRILGEEGGVVSAQANYVVLQTHLDPIDYGSTEVYSAGEYRDKIIFTDGVAKLKEKIVVVDTSRISSLLVTPL